MREVAKHERAEVGLHADVPRFRVADFSTDYGREDGSLPVTSVLHVRLPLLAVCNFPVTVGGRRRVTGQRLYAALPTA